MNDNDTYTKTADGIDELKSRSRGLAPRLRALLIMIDGTRTRAQLAAAAAGLGAPADFLDQLETAGLVQLQVQRARAAEPRAPAVPAPVPVPVPVPEPIAESQIERFMAARKLMNTTAVDALGLRVFMFTLKLERCANTEDLRRLLPEFTQALAKARGDLFARRVSDEVRLLLG